MSTPEATAPVRYALDLRGRGHEIGVTLTVPRPAAGAARFWMPAWAPGSYLIREFARHVDSFRASQAGRDLPVSKLTKDEWEVGGVEEGVPLEVAYRLYAHELTVRTNYLGPDRALLCGSATFVVPAGSEAGPFRLEVAVPEGWGAPECALPKDGDAFVASDLDALLDAPVAAGPCAAREFTARGVPHRVVAYGSGDCDVDALTADLRRIAEAAADVFGGEIPCPRYLFIVELGCAGGLEHADSSVCGLPVLGFADEAERRRRLALMAHEYFHLWNVKRVRPSALGPFDYRREVHTPHLWVAEGLTTYFQHLLLLRAGLVAPDRFLAILASYLLDLERTPGRHVQSLVESSHDAWIKYYRPDENARNSRVSYYDKGAVAGLVLDLEIRRRTGGERGLEDAFRVLWRRFRERPEAGYTDDELRSALAEAAGEALDDVVAECAGRPGDVDVAGRLAKVGLEIARRTPDPGGCLGAALRDRSGRLVVESIVRDGPAWESGLSPGEEIIALDGFRVGRGDILSWLGERRPGDAVVLTAALWGRLREVRVRLGPRPSRDYRFSRTADLDAPGRAAFAAWLGTPWESFRPLDERQEEQRVGDLPLDA